MNPIQKAISEVKFRIPLDILNAAFIRPEFGQRALPLNIDTLIRQKVIEDRVRIDCDLVGGNEILVPLIGVTPEYIDQFHVVYRIPKALTQNRSITRALSITMGLGTVMGTTNMGLTGSSPLLDATAAVMASQLPIPPISTAYVELIAENTVLVSDTFRYPSDIYLRCKVEHDSDFTQMSTPTYHRFARLVELATKAYIYNNLIIAIGQGQLYGGQDLGKFKEIVEGFADANDLYDTFLNDTWKRVAIMDDGESFRRHLKLLSGGLR